MFRPKPKDLMNDYDYVMLAKQCFKNPIFKKDVFERAEGKHDTRKQEIANCKAIVEKYNELLANNNDLDEILKKGF